ncbi:MAG: large conductance mechanosensitive channel protein MscL [Bacilli bacterium]|nr:large conductance mechanosensitive channel protein MscL [Bacilli bacterium]
MKKFFNEFKAFLNRGNAFEMAIGIIMGASFKTIVSSLVDDIIMPLISSIGGVNIKDLSIVLKEAVIENDVVVKAAVTLNYGSFIQAIIDFLIIAFTIFIIVKAMNKFNANVEKMRQKLLKEQKEKEEQAKIEEIQHKETIEDILKDIREELKNGKTTS